MGGDGEKSFIEGAVILSAAGLIAKIMGFGYRIVLPRVIGDKGVGLYQLAYPIYTTLLVVSRSGIPVSLAKLISDRIAKEERKAAFKIFRVGRIMSIIIGASFLLLMVILARPIINFLEWDSEAIYPVLAISPAIFFVSIMATYRGFFQGLQDMVPTAYSQVIEQLIRMTTMIILVILLIPYGPGLGAAGATFGAVTGSIAGLLTLLYIYNKRKNKIWKFVQIGSQVEIDTKKIIRDIASLGIPVTIGALVLPIMNFVDAAIVPQRLIVAGFRSSRALELYGQLSGMAMVLVNFPTIITISLAASLVPSISEAFALKESLTIKKRTEAALKLTILIGLPSAVGLFILAEPLTGIIFDNFEAAIPLRFLAWGVLFITLQQTSSAILQGIGKTGIPALNLFIGAIINAIINYTLTAITHFGIRGAATGTVVGFGVAALLNLVYVKIYTNFSLKFKVFILKPIVSILIMAFVVKEGFQLILYVSAPFIEYNFYLATFLTVLIAVLVYILTLLLLNEIKYNDIVLIPKIGKKLADNLKKIGLVGDNDENG
ncbi:MAG: putative polysaccharide biosynthesis protein [Halanaerobiales bacterium]